MKCSYYHTVIFILAFAIQGCCGCDQETTPEQPVLTFAIAGHVYGNPDTYTSSVYPPFLQKLKADHVKKRFDFLFLTGDVVAHPTESNWITVADELNAVRIPWYISRGNHDVSQYMDEHIQPEKYLSIQKENALFLVLNTSHPGWTVDSLQRNFLIRELSHTDSIEQIFVFSHQLWWERNPPKEFELDSLRPNSFAGYDGTSDFWHDVFPYFDSTGIETWFFAGDMGCHYTLPSYYEDHYKNFHFYGSGMGGGIDDNYLTVEVYQNGSVDIEKVPF